MYISCPGPVTTMLSVKLLCSAFEDILQRNMGELLVGLVNAYSPETIWALLEHTWPLVLLCEDRAEFLGRFFLYLTTVSSFWPPVALYLPAMPSFLAAYSST